MAFEDNLPQSADVLVQRSKTDVQRKLDEVTLPGENRANVSLPASWLGAIPTANANRVYDYTLQLREAVRLNMPDTAVGEFADRWGAIYVGPRTEQVGSGGQVFITGTAASVVPSGTDYALSGVFYETTADATITAQSIDVLSLTRLGDTVTATTDGDHGLASAVPVAIAGAVETEYNGAQTITVTGPDTFTYTVSGSPASPATGTITAAFTGALAPVVAVVGGGFGEASNQPAGAALALQVSIAGVDSSAYVTWAGLTGGADEETDGAYVARYLEKARNPVAHFNSQDIDNHIRANVEGVTRTFIQKSGAALGSQSVASITRSGVFATVTTGAPHGLFDGAEVDVTGADQPEYNVSGVPILVLSTTSFGYVVSGSPASPATGTITADAVVALGRVRVYFTRDLDDDGPIPSAGEVAAVAAVLAEIVPANTPDSYVIVEAPTAAPVAFTFSAITPDNASLRAAVEANLAQFFGESVTVGAGVDQDAYRSAIYNTVDPANGQRVTDFELSTPTGDVAGVVGALPTLGAVTWP